MGVVIVVMSPLSADWDLKLQFVCARTGWQSRILDGKQSEAPNWFDIVAPVILLGDQGYDAVVDGSRGLQMLRSRFVGASTIIVQDSACLRDRLLAFLRGGSG
jgi:hypothetical protein